MQECIKAVHLEHAGEPGCDVRRFGPEHAKKVQKFHESFPEYTKTPLAHLSNLAKQLGVADIYVKDESYRFGLNAFKVLEASVSEAILQKSWERISVNFPMRRSPKKK